MCYGFGIDGMFAAAQTLHLTNNRYELVVAVDVGLDLDAPSVVRLARS